MRWALEIVVFLVFAGMAAPVVWRLRGLSVLRAALSREPPYMRVAVCAFFAAAVIYGGGKGDGDPPRSGESPNEKCKIENEEMGTGNGERGTGDAEQTRSGVLRVPRPDPPPRTGPGGAVSPLQDAGTHHGFQSPLEFCPTTTNWVFHANVRDYVSLVLGDRNGSEVE